MVKKDRPLKLAEVVAASTLLADDSAPLRVDLGTKRRLTLLARLTKRTVCQTVRDLVQDGLYGRSTE